MTLHQEAPRGTPLPSEDCPQFREIPILLLDRKYIAHVVEPAPLTTVQFLRCLRTGQYAKPFVLDDGRYRQLHFCPKYIQSRMSLANPDALNLAYTRKMMSFLLFNPQPRQIVIVGLGGGSLTKFCYRQLPDAGVTTIEIDQTVIELSRLFQVPRPNGRMRLVHSDATSFFRSMRRSADVVLVDGCNQHGIAPELSTESFLLSVRRRLRPDGILVINLVGAIGHSDKLIHAIARVFDGQVLLIEASVGGNCIALAFRNPCWLPHWPEIRQRAASLGAKHKLDFVDFAARLQLNARKARTSPRPRAMDILD